MLLSRLSMTKVMKALVNTQARGQARLPNPELIEVEF